MPAYQPTDPRHPTNRAQLVWLACEKAGQVGRIISRKKWHAILRLATGGLTSKALDDYTDHMEGLLMVKKHDRRGIEPRAHGLRLVRPDYEPMAHQLAAAQPLAIAA